MCNGSDLRFYARRGNRAYLPPMGASLLRTMRVRFPQAAFIITADGGSAVFVLWEANVWPEGGTVVNKRRKDFAEFYIQTGNAAEAARKAGYSERTARTIGQRLLTFVDVSAYITERMKEMREKQIATSDEVVIFFTSVLRGEKQGEETPSVKHRLEAGKELLKRFEAAATEPGGVHKEDDPLTKALREEAERLDADGIE